MWFVSHLLYAHTHIHTTQAREMSESCTRVLSRTQTQDLLHAGRLRVGGVVSH